MEIRPYLKQEIALKQIETALELYFQDGDLFSVITLAGAAEEILAQFPKVLAAREPAFQRIFKSIFRILRITPGPEEGVLQHQLEDEEVVHMDVRQEAVFLLGRAIDDYQTLSGMLTPAMLKFNTEARGNRQ